MPMKHAISSHSTKTTAESWTGDSEDRKQGPAICFRTMAAFCDGDECQKESYRFFHHAKEEDGSLGAANLNACIAGITELNDVSSTIPEESRRAVWRHLSRHLEDAEVEPPPLKEMGLKGEEREFVFDEEEEGLKIRQDGDDPPVIVGYASVFNKLSLPMGFGFERVQKGAWAESIRKDDIRALWNHDSNIVLGRNRAKPTPTLNLKEDRKGLRVEIHPPSSFDQIESIERGDVSGMSIRFTVQEQKFKNLDKPDETVRTIIKGTLREVSPVTFPAFPDTTVAVRAIQELIQADISDDEWRRQAEERNRRIKLIDLGVPMRVR